MRLVSATGYLAAALIAFPASATTSGWQFGKWLVVLAPAENILVLAQDGRGIDVEVLSEGPELRFSFDTARCRGRGQRIDGVYTLPRARWDQLSTQARLQHLKDKFGGWEAEADAACPSRKHRLDPKRLEDAFHQFDAQLAMIAP
jgi:hypothetical protein